VPRAGSDRLTEEARAAIQQRGTTTGLQAAVERIAAAEMVPKAQIYRKAVREFVARWEEAHRSIAAPVTPRPGIFP
jgi:hypothetical protein